MPYDASFGDTDVRTYDFLNNRDKREFANFKKRQRYAYRSVDKAVGDFDVRENALLPVDPTTNNIGNNDAGNSKITATEFDLLKRKYDQLLTFSVFMPLERTIIKTPFQGYCSIFCE